MLLSSAQTNSMHTSKASSARKLRPGGPEGAGGAEEEGMAARMGKLRCPDQQLGDVFDWAGGLSER